MKIKFLNFLSFLLGAAAMFLVAEMLWDLQKYEYVTFEKQDFSVDPARPAVLVYDKFEDCYAPKLPPKNFRETWTWREAAYVFSPDEEREISEILSQENWESYWRIRPTCEIFWEPAWFILNLKIPFYKEEIGFRENGAPTLNLPEKSEQRLQEIISKIIKKIEAGDVPAETQKVFGNAIFDEFLGWKFENEIRGNAENSATAGTHFVVDFDVLNRVRKIQKFDGNAKIWEREYVYEDSWRELFNFEAPCAIHYADAEKTLTKSNL